MKRKTKAFLLAFYLFISTSLCSCQKNKKIKEDENQEVIDMKDNENQELNDIIKESLPSITENIEIVEITEPEIFIEETEAVVIETEPVVVETEPVKTIDELALEIIGNKYGGGEQRRMAVEEQGFDYYEVSRRVDEILAGASYSIPDRNTYNYWFAYAPNQISVYNEDGVIEGTLTQYQKVLILYELDEYYFVAFHDQTFHVKKDEIKMLADSHLELDISEQKVYMYIDGVMILSADVITGHPDKGTVLGTNLGISQVYSKSYNVTFEGGKESKYFILFNWDGEGFHDANWREDWEYENKERYIIAGSNGCCNMKEEDVIVIEQNSYIGMPVLIHR